MIELVKTDRIDPSEMVLPLFGQGSDGGIADFLGTGFFIGDQCLMATAYHVLKDRGASFVTVLSSAPEKRFPAKLESYDTDTDLALLRVEGFRPGVWFALAGAEDIQPQRLVVCNEFGTTTVLGRQTQLSMATRVGNITRIFKRLEPYGKAGEEMLELSFPALRGASGAPVVTSDHGLVLGIVVANADYHLLPAQIETTYDVQGEPTEEIRYLLPQALAVNCKHLKALLRAARNET